MGLGDEDVQSRFGSILLNRRKSVRPLFDVISIIDSRM
jgi:hypothetical protein